VIWSSSGAIQDLGIANSTGIDINASGKVIGSMTVAGETHFFLFSPGAGVQDLTTLLGALTSVVEINDAGQIIGTFTAPDGAEHAFLYTPGSGLLDLGTLGGATSAPTGLNGKGQVVGTSLTEDGAAHAFLWTSTGGMEDITVKTGVSEVRRLNDNLQTLTGTAPPVYGSLRRVIPRLVQLQVTSNDAPVARFTASCDGLTCSFDASTSSDDSAIVAYEWDLNKYPDGTATGVTTTAAYAHSGTRSVTLTVRDANGLTNSVTQTITIDDAPAPDAPPVARFTWSCPSLTCTFDATASSDDVGIVSYDWDLNRYPDGTASGVTLTTPYAHGGTRSVTLTVRDAKGQTNSVTQTITIP
jgi:probable HAF family extracellular repeat protein